MKKSKTKIHITVIMCKATITPISKLMDYKWFKKSKFNKIFFFRLLVEKRPLESFCSY